MSEADKQIVLAATRMRNRLHTLFVRGMIKITEPADMVAWEEFKIYLDAFDDLTKEDQDGKH